MATSEWQPLKHRLLRGALSLGLDIAAAEVVTALRNVSIRSILLRGPALALWLYEDGTRFYSDVDLLVAPDDFARAEQVLARLGFKPSAIAPPAGHAQLLRRQRDSAAVDLHRAIVGVGVGEGEAWNVLADCTEAMSLGGEEFEVLRPQARAMLVALHAAQHGVAMPQPLEDLSRALERFEQTDWTASAALADRLEATEAFSAGLRLLPPGEMLATRLGLPLETSVGTVLRARTAVNMSLGFERLAQTSGLREKLRLARRKALPEIEFMRAWTPLARRGRTGLPVAYAWRLAWLLWHAPAGFRAWWRARSEVR
jgi:putative nucleotidyltransferase-like protein